MIENILGISFSFLSFIIVYGMLNKIGMFERSINVIISSVLSLFVLSAFVYYKNLIVIFFSISILIIISVFILLSIYFYRSKNIN
jgi:hypothetical protein